MMYRAADGLQNTHRKVIPRVKILLFTSLLGIVALTVWEPVAVRSENIAIPAFAADPDEIHSDFNGDGYDDLAIGVAGENEGESDSGPFGGAVHVIYSSGTAGLQTTSPGDQLWDQDSEGVKDSAEALESFGTSLSAADFNGDGYSDLAIGSLEEIGSLIESGAVNVLYGSAVGLQADSPDDQFWHQDSPGVDNPAEDGDAFGLYLGSGDFNNDGYADLAIGAPTEEIDGVEAAGAVHVLYGSSSGLQTSSPADQFWNQNRPGVHDTPEENDSFGNSLAVGDFNSDEYDDLAIGVRHENAGGGSGAIHILHGSASGLQTTSPDEQFWHEASFGVEPTLVGFATALAANDFNGDGYVDLAINSPSTTINGVAGAGAVHIMHGSETGLQTSSPAVQFWNQDSLDLDNPAEELDGFGSSLVGGDLNGDGFADLAITVVNEEVGGVERAGAVNVLYGSSGGLATAPAQDATGRTDQFWHQGSPSIEDSPERFDGFGFAMIVRDYNNDGFGDLAISARTERVGSIDIAGAVHVIHGSSEGLQTSSPADQFWNQNKPGMDDVPEEQDQFGYALG